MPRIFLAWDGGRGTFIPFGYFLHFLIVWNCIVNNFYKKRYFVLQNFLLAVTCWCILSVHTKHLVTRVFLYKSYFFIPRVQCEVSSCIRSFLVHVWNKIVMHLYKVKFYCLKEKCINFFSWQFLIVWNCLKLKFWNGRIKYDLWNVLLWFMV